MYITAALIPMIIFLLTFAGAVYVASIDLSKGVVWASVAFAVLMWVFWLNPNGADVVSGVFWSGLVLLVVIYAGARHQDWHEQMQRHHAEEYAREIEYELSNLNTEV